jgi:hypothetical protein
MDVETEKLAPKSLFLSLPREIRDEIYKHAVTSRVPLRVWNGAWDEEPLLRLHWMADVHPAGKPYDIYRNKYKCLWRYYVNQRLLLCGNKQVHYEAASIFYGKNNFEFRGDHDWDVIVTWLQKIGSFNRSCLSKLSIDIVRLRDDLVWQEENGARTRRRSGSALSPLPIHPKHSALTAPQLVTEGYVYSINPVLEAVFKLLSNSRVTIKLVINDFEDHPSYSPNQYMTIADFMDLPNLIKLFCTTYEHKPGAIKVFWKCKMDYADFLKKKNDIIKQWHIFEERQIEDGTVRVGNKTRTKTNVIVIVNKKPLVGALMAQTPLSSVAILTKLAFAMF